MRISFSAGLISQRDTQPIIHLIQIRRFFVVISMLFKFSLHINTPLDVDEVILYINTKLGHIILALPTQVYIDLLE